MDQNHLAYEFLLRTRMKRDSFIDMITAICLSHRDMFNGFEGNALDADGNLKEEYCLGTSHVIACMVAQRLDCAVESQEPMAELLLQRIRPVSRDAQRGMVEGFLQCYE